MSDRNALQSFLQTYGQGELANIPHNTSQCCCGNNSCSYLRHNQAALDDLERDVRNSAELGQALVMRHETYMADAEHQRKLMTEQLETLESEKTMLRAKNESLVQENRGLLDQLEALNNAVADSDAQVISLQSTLQSAQHEIHKLSQLAAKTERLEQDLLAFETQQSNWQTSLTAKDEAERSAIRRWQDAERTLTHLQDQLERIEREASEEKARHADVVARMERRRDVEKELASAADRLKGSAGSKDSGGSTVVSHFVKDILQDNATLQLGIVELREMLQSSNEEVEKLRDQLILHQPADDDEGDRPTIGRSVSLNDELSRAKAQELHVHHHYHASSNQANRANTLRRPKKKRYGSLNPGSLSATSSGRSTPRSSVSYGPSSSTAAILQQTGASVPQTIPSGKRWSAQSINQGQSVYSFSGPSSPASTTNRTSSMYDRVFSDGGQESTSPTTSDSETFGSPYFTPAGSKRQSALSMRTFSAPLGHIRGFGSVPGKHSLDSILDTSVEDLPPLDQHLGDHDAIAEEFEDIPDDSVSPSTEAPSTTTALSAADDTLHGMSAPWQRPLLRRAASHESLLSISGMDIHTLKDRPSQLLIPNGGVSSGAVVTNFQAQAAVGNTGYQGIGRSLLSGMAADQRRASAEPKTIRKKASGWIFGRWGATPNTTTITTTATPTPSRGSDGSSKRAPSIASASSDTSSTPVAFKLRSPGINQSGPILGFAPEVKVQHPPILKTLDQDALTKVLDEA